MKALRIMVAVMAAALLSAPALAAPTKTPAAAAKTPADEALDAARAEYQSLRKDEGRRRFRHNWLNVAKKFELISQRFPKSERAPEALYLAGDLFNELNRFSGNPDDLGFAEKSYKKLLDGWPRHRLADDAALSLAHLLADRKDDPSGAKKVIEKALDDAGDRKKELSTLLASLKEAAKSSVKKAKDDDDDAPVAKGGRAKPEGPPKIAATTAEKSRGGKAQAKRADDDEALAGKATAPDKSRGAKADSRRPDDDEAPAGKAASNKATGLAPGVAKAAVATITGPAKGAAIAPATAPAAKAPAGPPAKPGVAEAIRRLTSTTSVLVSPRAEAIAKEKEAAEEEKERDEKLKKDELQARRLPPVRPREEERAEPDTRVADDVDESGSPSAIAALQERLRDVRVGAKKPAAATDADAKVRLQKLANEEPRAEVTLAEQLGLKVRRVIVDAGHGGHDAGAIGLKGTREKDVSLAIAKKLSAKLEEMGLEVIMTRDDDTFVKLEDRTRIANKEKGDLFISVHCNAAPSRKLRGIETYTLNISSNRYAMRLAARENASSEKGISDLQYILADLATKGNVGEATRLAEKVQKGLIHTLSGTHKDIADLGTKEALFFVLLGAKMPAILVETSFISNPEDEQRLASDEYQAEVAGSIAASVGDFLEERSKLAQLE